jgi:hypothetical protein
VELDVTIDVEEEGLFRGRYETGSAPVENVSRLNLLTPLLGDLGIRPTLLVSYQVAQHPRQMELVLKLRDQWKGEIGAHLHPWNTPPSDPDSPSGPVVSESIPRNLLKAKLETLIQALNQAGVKPLSFRMGRFNMGPRMFSVLEEEGIRVDSSVVPLRWYRGSPCHVSAPIDPYFPDPGDICKAGDSTVLEVPITIVPFVKGVRAFLEGVGRIPGPFSRPLSAGLQRLCLLPAQPFWTGLRRLKAAVKLHQKSGGRVVTIFFHSSELMPGGSPRQRTQDDVRAFLRKLENFLHWLKYTGNAESRTLSEMHSLYGRSVTGG